jgi:ABC-type Fe3+-citrate transport system substrate-binding protein
MKGIDTEAENARLKAEIATLKNKNKNLSEKLEKSKIKKTQLQQELKKNDALIITLSKEQEQSLSNLSSDINILNLLSD